MKSRYERLRSVTLETWVRLITFAMLCAGVLMLIVGCGHLEKVLATEPTPCFFKKIEYEKAKPGLQAGAKSSLQNYQEIRELVIQLDQHNAVWEKFCGPS